MSQGPSLEDKGRGRAVEVMDVHHHALPPSYVASCRDRILGPAVDLEHVLGWTPERSLEQMDANGVDRAILSISAPGIWFGDPDETSRLARECNDYLADLKRRHRDRFGFFATMPLPDVAATAEELDRAFEELDPDGVCLMSSYEDIWLGDARFRPIFESLQRRRTTVFVHPVVPDRCAALMDAVPSNLAEFSFDTTRTVLSLLFEGVFTDSPDVRFLFAHGGGALPMLLDRIVTFPKLRPAAAAAVPDGVMHELDRLFFDTGSVSHPVPFAALRAWPGIRRLAFASDFPYRPIEVAQGALAAVASADERAAIETKNPRRLLGGGEEQ